MANKSFNFSVYQLIVDGQSFSRDTFSALQSEEIDKFKFTNIEQQEEVLNVKKIFKNDIDDRFISIYFLEGAKYPYSETVVNDELEESENPRHPDQIEMDDQLFALIDIERQRVYISDGRRKHLVSSWLSNKVEKEITIKSIMDEDEFIERLKTISEIQFTLLPDLLTGASNVPLARALLEDIYGYGADKAKLKLQYENTRVTDTIKEKIRNLLSDRGTFQSIVVIGHDEEDFESVFNLEKIVSKQSVILTGLDESELINPSTLFSSLVSAIKSNEE
jgi:hypothetical protein